MIKAAASASIDHVILGNTQNPRNYKGGIPRGRICREFCGNSPPRTDLWRSSSCQKNTQNSSTKFTKRCGFFSTIDETQNARGTRRDARSAAIGLSPNSPRTGAQKKGREGEITREWTGTDRSGVECAAATPPPRGQDRVVW